MINLLGCFLNGRGKVMFTSPIEQNKSPLGAYEPIVLLAILMCFHIYKVGDPLKVKPKI